MVGLFIDDAIEIFLSQVAVALIQIILFTIFIYMLVFPISYALREVQTGQLELVLSAPVKPSDVLLGEFLGMTPLYAAVITIIAGFFTAILSPMGLDLLQILIILIIFVVTFLSAAWIGTIIASLLRTKLGKTARGRDIGKGLSLIIALPLITIMYAMMGGGLLQVLADPGTSGTVRTILGFLPSSWGADIIISFAVNPGNIAAVGYETLMRFGGLLIFFIGSLWIGVKVANKAYSLEPSTFGTSRVKADGTFYHTIKYLSGGGYLGIIVVSLFKDYVRRLENLSRVIFMIGTVFLLNIFLSRTGDAINILEYSSIVYALLAAFVGLEVTIRGKESLFTFKKAPSGLARFIRARLLHGWMIVTPVAAIATIIQLILLVETSLNTLVIVTIVVTLTAAASMAFAIGVSLVHPIFSTNQAKHTINLLAVVMFSNILRIIAYFIDNMWIILPITSVMGIVMLYLGKRNLGRIE